MVLPFFAIINGYTVVLWYDNVKNKEDSQNLIKNKLTLV